MKPAGHQSGRGGALSFVDPLKQILDHKTAAKTGFTIKRFERTEKIKTAGGLIIAPFLGRQRKINELRREVEFAKIGHHLRLRGRQAQALLNRSLKTSQRFKQAFRINSVGEKHVLD